VTYGRDINIMKCMYKILFVCEQYKYGYGAKLLSLYLTISADKILTLVTYSL